ncbi:Nucleotidyltransferase domain protein, BT0168 group [hydrothermal vent metagenome]|uniref:Nucleotidyltransferase domain protein, BT0168 group n=1 Tax=hydrothermal vent metagenome TaxID=652676 RepID=A0A3B0UQ62_9ZZZZ
MKSLSDLKKVLTQNKPKLLAEYPIKSLAIFGSYARKEQQANSDLDVLVEFRDSIGIRFIDLADDIEHIMGIKVDLVSKNGIKPKYFEAIKSDLVYV